jgi:GAF domain-containing protein/HAMP domain-containing protein
MTERRRLYIPLWLKIFLGISIVAALLVIPTIALMQTGIYELSLEAGKLFTAEIGAQRAESIATAINNARVQITRFATESQNLRLFHSLLLGPGVDRAAINLPTVRPADAARLFRSTLLNPATSIYDYIRLVDRSGNVIAQSSLIPGGVLATNLNNLTDNSTFLAALNADLQGQDRAIVVNLNESAGGQAPVELIEVLRWRDGSTIGFLIARLNYDRVLLNHLRLTPTWFTPTANQNALLFLTTREGAIIVLSDYRQAAERAKSELPALRALNNQRGIEVFQRSQNVDETIAFYTPVAGTPLALVVQTEAEASFNVALSYFTQRAFVLIIGVVALVGILVLLFSQLILPPINRLRSAAQALASGDFSVPVTDAGRGDELGDLAMNFVSMRESIRNQFAEQETRLDERARDFAATQEIGRVATTQRDLQRLLDSVVELITQRFSNIYHAQIFLNDSENVYAILRASTGDAGRELLARGHRLAVGSVSVIGQATGQGRVIVARDTAASPVHRRNELLPDTRAELAIPLRVGDTVIGALDVQSRLGNAFTEGQIGVLQAMADQVAVAIENARLYQESIRRAAEIEEGNRRATQRAWADFMRDQRSMTLLRQAGAQTDTDISELRRQAQREGRTLIGRPTERGTIPIAVPVMLRGQTLGAVEWELPAQGFGEDKVELAEELAARLAVSLDNARLFQESRRAVERERTVNLIAGRLAAQTSIDELLKTAVREAGQALRTPAVGIRLSSDKTSKE